MTTTTNDTTISMLEFIDETQLESNWPHWTDHQLASKCKELCETAIARRVREAGSPLTPSMRRALADWAQQADWLLVAQAVRSRSTSRAYPGHLVALAKTPHVPYGLVVHVSKRDVVETQRDLYICRYPGDRLIRLPEEQVVRLRRCAWFARVMGMEQQEPRRTPEDAMVLALLRYDEEELDELPEVLCAIKYLSDPVNEVQLTAEVLQRVGDLLPGFKDNLDTQQAAQHFVRYVTRDHVQYEPTENVVHKRTWDIIQYYIKEQDGYLGLERVQAWAESRGHKIPEEETSSS